MVGLKTTEMVHLAPADRLEPQVLVSVYSPLTAMLVMASEPPPVLVKVAVCAALNEPMGTRAKFRA